MQTDGVLPQNVKFTIKGTKCIINKTKKGSWQKWKYVSLSTICALKERTLSTDGPINDLNSVY